MDKREAQLLARAIAIAAEAHQDGMDEAGVPDVLEIRSNSTHRITAGRGDVCWHLRAAE